MDISNHLMLLDAKRAERKMSYQDLADACGVSKATIYRTMNGTTDPSARLVQSIEAAVQYAPAEPETLPPAGCSNEEYTDYLRTTIIRREAEYQRHILQLQTHYSILNRQNRRVILVMGIAITVLVVFLVGWLIFDIMHPEIGWIQR